MRILGGICVGIFCFLFLYFGIIGHLKSYLFLSGYSYWAEQDRADELQDFVTAENISVTDTAKILQWSKERRIYEFEVYQDDSLILNASSEAASSVFWPMTPNLSRYFYSVQFKDGLYLVYLNEGAGIGYYRLLFFLALLFGFLSFLAVFVAGMQEDVHYIQKLEREVSVLTTDNLQHSVTIFGNDELAHLAEGLNRMRISLIEKEQTEQELRDAQQEMVLGMSHDLKTPITGLLASMEVLKSEQTNNPVYREYLDKAYRQIIRLRNLSNRIFEYFLIDSERQVELEDAEMVEWVIGDQLSELCAILESMGFRVEIGETGWPEAMMRINMDYLGRITNNILSNIERYADRNVPIRISMKRENDYFCLTIQNGILTSGTYKNGTGIGIRNISMMMKKMKGHARIERDETQKLYGIRLAFSLCAS